MRVSHYLNQTNPISKMLEEVVGGKVEASSHRFLWQKKNPQQREKSRVPTCSAAAGAQRNLDLELVRFFNALAPGNQMAFQNQEAGTSSWFKGNFTSALKTKTWKMSIKSMRVCQAVPQTVPWQLHLGHNLDWWEYIATSGRRVCCWIAIFQSSSSAWDNLSQFQVLIALQVFFSHMTLGVHRYVACAQWPCNISTARCRAPSHRSLPLPCGTWQQEMTADKHRKLSGTQLLRRWMWFVES